MVMSWRGGGVRNWVVQRISALYMALFVIGAAAFASGMGQISFTNWTAVIANPVFSVLLMMFFIALLVHAWVGVRDVVVDYVHHDGLRFVVLVVFALYLLAMLLWVMRVLLNPLGLA
jgi:succinate dehydrogenase / fumarate reductase membrane anchor subunit